MRVSWAVWVMIDGEGYVGVIRDEGERERGGGGEKDWERRREKKLSLEE